MYGIVLHHIVFPLTKGRDFALLVIIVPFLCKVHFSPNVLNKHLFNEQKKPILFSMIQSQNTPNMKSST